MYRAAALILAIVVVVIAVRLGEEPVRAIHKPEVRPAPDAFETVGTSRAEGGGAAGSASDEGEPKIGNFEAPKYAEGRDVVGNPSGSAAERHWPGPAPAPNGHDLARARELDDAEVAGVGDVDTAAPIESHTRRAVERRSVPCGAEHLATGKT